MNTHDAQTVRLPEKWRSFLAQELNLSEWQHQLDRHLSSFSEIIPERGLIFNALELVPPERVCCVLFGEDPYPRVTSANGVAFWDAEIKSWQDKTNGNALKNILKALLVARGKADYFTSIAACRQLVAGNGFKQPAQLFTYWLRRGVLLINTAMTFSGAQDKKRHFNFWRPFHQALIRSLNRRSRSPVYILWGRSAWSWQPEILQTIDDPAKILRHGHPTFIHQFLNKELPRWSPFTEIEQATGFRWS